VALHTQNRGLEFALLLTLPSAAALIVIAGPIISVLFERGHFVAADTAATAATLAAYASGLPAYVLVRVLAPGFFAREDTVTPVRVAAASMVANIVLNLILMQVLAYVGIALAASLAAWMNAGLLWVILRQRAFLKMDAQLRRRLPRIGLATLLMAGVLALGQMALGGMLAGSTAMRAGALALLVGGGLVAFGVFVQLTGGAAISDVKRMLRREAA